jgi:hypothetical protein
LLIVYLLIGATICYWGSRKVGDGGKVEGRTIVFVVLLWFPVVLIMLAETGYKSLKRP